LTRGDSSAISVILLKIDCWRWSSTILSTFCVSWSKWIKSANC